MRKKWIIFLLFMTFTSINILSCGKKVPKETFTAEKYFEYAKNLFDKEKYLDAITEFTVITLKFSGNPLVDDAQFYLAESHYMNEEYLIAVAEYQKLVNDYPESPYVPEAFYKVGMSFLNLSQRPELDQEYTLKSLRQFQNFIEAYPDSEYRQKAEERILELRSKLARKQLLGANVYRKMGIYDSAIIYYNILLEKYYDTPTAEEALFWKAECQYKLKLYEEALTSFTIFVEKYPESSFVGEAKTRISKIQKLL
ncbi:MAG: outer membrane protein assembly factor BamD [Calditrichaeota bacterium]|nr:outer membrane protein assembly factor BamD [Calditrichota bacterium]RQW08258.1 MAG: outer membrane protein assembly factor BamD [Calditrichota bacterium]